MVERLNPSDLLPALVIVSSLGVGMVIAIVALVANMYKARAREDTKREIAAYVAEGTIDPDTAIALLKADAASDARIAEMRAAMGHAPKAKVARCC